MAHGCRLVRLGRTSDATWRRDGDMLVVSPNGAPALPLALGEAAGIGGDGFSIAVRMPAGDVVLERLGADGPTLLKDLRRDWPPLRARLLRLSTGAAPAALFAGHVACPNYTGAFHGFIEGHRLVFAPEGGDLMALFLADLRQVDFAESSYSVLCSAWTPPDTTFSRLGSETARFREALAAARGSLALEADATLARHLPTLSPTARANLAFEWLPGRVLSFAELERIGPGFEAAFRASWLRASHRPEEGLTLMEGVAATDRYLGYADPAEDGEQMLWLLVRQATGWALELLSHGDYATYLFSPGDDVPGLVAGIVRLPEFSREALYMPLEDLTGDRSKYAIPARDLPLLRDLRAHFAGRRIHPPRQARGEATG